MNPVNRPASGEIRKKWWLVWLGGALANFAEVPGMCERELGKVLRPVVLTNCSAKTQCGKEASVC